VCCAFIDQNVQFQFVLVFSGWRDSPERAFVIHRVGQIHYNSPEALVSNGQVYVHDPSGVLAEVTLASDVYTLAFVLAEVLDSDRRRVFHKEFDLFKVMLAW
jgi:hypothetical protein